MPSAAGPEAEPSWCTFQGAGLCSAPRHCASPAPGFWLAGPAPPTSPRAELGVASPGRRLPPGRQGRAAGWGIWLSVVPPGLAQWAQTTLAASLRCSLPRWAVRAAQSGRNSEMSTFDGEQGLVCAVCGRSLRLSLSFGSYTLSWLSVRAAFVANNTGPLLSPGLE